MKICLLDEKCNCPYDNLFPFRNQNIIRCDTCDVILKRKKRILKDMINKCSRKELIEKTIEIFYQKEKRNERKHI